MPPRKSEKNVLVVSDVSSVSGVTGVPSIPPPSPPVVAPPPRPAVTLVQVDDRSMADQLQGPLRTWRGADNHEAMRQAYSRSTPPPPRRGHWTSTALFNAYQCKKLAWKYSYVQRAAPENKHPSWCKVRWTLDSWAEFSPGDVVVVMDSDAWIRDAEGLDHLLTSSLIDGDCRMVVGDEPKCRETLEHGACDMNAGFVAFVVSDCVKQYFEAVWASVDTPDLARYANDWPREQACMCKAYVDNVAECKSWTTVLPVAVVNTPAGTLVSHCWYKDLTHDLIVDDMFSAIAQDVMNVPRSSVEFAVSRFDESVDWVYEWLPFVDRVTIYNKGEPLEIPAHPKVVVVTMPNVGREAHTYAHHFATRRDSLCDLVVCTQAGWSDHMSPDDFERMVKTKTRGTNDGLDVAWTKTPMQHFNWTAEKNHSTTPMTPAGMTMAKFYLKYVAGDTGDIGPESEVKWWHYGIFATTKDKVLKHPTSKYEALREALSGGSNPETAIMMERMWKLLLDP